MRNRLGPLLAAAALFALASRSNAQIVFSGLAPNNGPVFVETNTGVAGPGVGYSIAPVVNQLGTFTVVDSANPLIHAIFLAYKADLTANSIPTAPGSISVAAMFSSTLVTTTAPAHFDVADFTQPISGGSNMSWTIVSTQNPAVTLLAGNSLHSRILGAPNGTAHQWIATDSLGEGVDLFPSANMPTVLALLQPASLLHAWEFDTSGRQPLNAQGTNGFLNSGSGTYSGTFSVSQVPEPGTLSLLFGSGIGGSLLMFRRRRRS